MKRVLIFFTWLMLMLPIFAGAQGIRVLSEDLDFEGDINGAQRKTVIIQNETDKAQTYLLKNLRGNIGSSQHVKVCIGNDCFDPKTEISKIKVELAAGEIMTDFYLEFDLGIVETRGSFDLFFINEKNIREAFIVEARYDVGNSTLAEDGYISDELKLSDVYPNPSQSVAQFDYEILDLNASARIAINSFIGNPVANYTLDPERNSLVINVSDFNPGV